MSDPMYARVIAWVGLALLLVLCLPLARIQKRVLDVYAWALRLALLAVLGAAAYLWFYPGNLPAGVTDALNGLPPLKTILPDAGSPHFGVCAAALVVIVLLPLLALLDVGRKLGGWRLGRLRALAAAPKVAEPSPAQEPPKVAAPLPPAPEPTPAPFRRRVDRQSAADALAAFGSRKAPARTPRPPEA
jgi:hypothetical protein